MATTIELYDYQKPHVEILINSLKINNRALDSSDTGTGKTITSIYVAIKMGLKPFIICPKSIIQPWSKCLTALNCEYYGISNYEKLQNCKYYNSEGIQNVCPFIEKEVSLTKTLKKTERKFKWKVPENCLVIMDEVHKCKNKQTSNAKMLIALSKTNAKILILSATACDKMETFLVAGLCLGFYNDLKEGKKYLEVTKMPELYKLIYPSFGSRMRIKNTGAIFKKNEVIADCIEMDCAEEIQKEYKIIEEAVLKLEKQEEIANPGFPKITYARMRIEQLKIPTFKKLIKEYLDLGCAVAVFVNFTGTLLTLAKEFNSDCLVYGEQSFDERNYNIHAFCTDVSNIIFCNIKSGGVGISLHDTIGNRQRVALISPSYSAIDTIQNFGRIYRAGAKTNFLQKIIYCKKTVEERMCEIMKKKIQNISCINDGVTDSYIIKNLLEENDVMEDMEISEFDKLYLKISVLHLKKDRLNAELVETENLIKEYSNQIEKYICYR